MDDRKNDELLNVMMSPQVRVKDSENEQKSTGAKNEDSHSGKKNF
jgi:hypothetical protein